MSKIQWTEETWNPVAGCSVTSPGCTNCYAMRMAARLAAISHAREQKDGTTDHLDWYRGLTKTVNGKPVWTGEVVPAPQHIIEQPLRWTKPRVIFVNSMADLFHHDVTDEQLYEIFAIMAMCPQHTFQILTKRARRMREWMIDTEDQRRFQRRQRVVWRHVSERLGERWERFEELLRIQGCATGNESPWPLTNVHLGVSAENQHWADVRIPELLRTPAAKRLVSAEPLLEPIDFTPYVTPPIAWGEYWCNNYPYEYPKHQVDQIFVGGESGPGARQCELTWFEDIINKCRDTKTSVFIKQLGAKWIGEHSIPSEPKDPKKWGNPKDWPESLRVREELVSS